MSKTDSVNIIVQMEQVKQSIKWLKA